MEINDSHLHLFRGGYPESLFAAVEDADAELHAYEWLRARYGINLGLVVGFEGEDSFAGNNSYLSELRQRHGWMRPLAYLSPGGRTLPTPDSGFIGGAVYLPAAHDAEWDEWWFSLLRAADRHAMVLSVNAPAVTHPMLVEGVHRTEAVRFAISHLGLPGAGPKPHADALRPLLGLGGHERVWVKLSGEYATSSPVHQYPHRSTQEWIIRLLTTFGEEKLLWGSDFSPSLGAVSFAQTLDPLVLHQLDDVGRRRVLGENLRALIGEPR